VYQGKLEKLTSYQAILSKHGFTDGEVCYIGDDLMDLPPMRRAGFPVAVANARPEIRAVAAYITTAPGGHGAAREVIEKILKFQGKWDAIMARYLA
jgi:3-deoxy-D-manno-octulosonate 8-phosphate phosphatase (KDO 8-P phosphatase)